MKNIFKTGLLAGLAAIVFSGCLKDDPITDYSDSGIKPVVLIPNGNFPRASSSNPIALEVGPAPYEFRLYARVSWSKPLGKALEVTFAPDNNAVTEYNTKFPPTAADPRPWTFMNADAYTVASYKVTIPADATEAYIPVMVNTQKIDLTKKNMLAFTMTDAQGETIASNFKTLIGLFLVKNKYDADYTATGYFFHPTGGRGLNMAKHMYTINATRCEIQLGDLAGYNYRFDVINDATVGNFEPIGSTPTGAQSNFMTGDFPGASASWAPLTPGIAPYVHATYNNTYDLATKTFWIHTGYGVGSTGQSGYSRQQYEKWVRK